MGRFSPTVAPVANDGLANALGNFTESYMQFAARRRQKDMDAIETGVGLTPADGSAPQATPSGPFAALKARLTGRTNPNDISTAVQNAAPAVQGASAVNAGVADALSRGESYTPDPNAAPEMPKYMRLPSGQVVATSMTPLGQRMMQQRLAALGMGSEIGLRNSEIRLNERKAKAPVLGEPGYATAMGAVAGAEANAKLPADIQAAVTKGQIDLVTGRQLALIRGQVDSALQGNQQRFTAGENEKNRGAEAERQTTAKGEELSNKLTEIKATQAGQILPSLIRGTKSFFGAGQVNVPGVTQPLGSKAAPAAATAPVADVKQQRADWDAAAAHARANKQDPDALLGPRP